MILAARWWSSRISPWFYSMIGAILCSPRCSPWHWPDPRRRASSIARRISSTPTSSSLSSNFANSIFSSSSFRRRSVLRTSNSGFSCWIAVASSWKNTRDSRRCSLSLSLCSLVQWAQPVWWWSSLRWRSPPCPAVTRVWGFVWSDRSWSPSCNRWFSLRSARHVEVLVPRDPFAALDRAPVPLRRLPGRSTSCRTARLTPAEWWNCCPADWSLPLSSLSDGFSAIRWRVTKDRPEKDIAENGEWPWRSPWTVRPTGDLGSSRPVVHFQWTRTSSRRTSRRQPRSVSTEWDSPDACLPTDRRDTWRTPRRGVTASAKSSIVLRDRSPEQTNWKQSCVGRTEVFLGLLPMEFAF